MSKPTTLAPPAVGPVPWRATVMPRTPGPGKPEKRKAKPGTQTTVEARLWFDARNEAARRLGVEPGELDVRPLPTPATEDRSSVAPKARR